MTTCPVCGMSIDEKQAAAQTTYKGETYHFCSETCKEQFEQQPENFTSSALG